MTASLVRTLRQAGLVPAFAVSLSALSSTQSFAFSAEDVHRRRFRLCSCEIPNIPKMSACMVKHRADLSAGCRTVKDRALAEPSSKIAAQ
jgi:hypothetical protein